MGGSVLGIERPQSLPPAVHLTGPLLFSDLSCNSRPCTNRSGKGRRAQLPSSLLRWVEGSDRSHVRTIFWLRLIGLSYLCVRV